MQGETGSHAEIFRRNASQVWNTSSGLPQDTVRQFLQTRDGFLWMATDGGLVRFDGYEFTVYDRRNTPQLQSDLINALFEDSSGSLWIATSNGLLKNNLPLREVQPSSTQTQVPAHFSRYTTQQGLPSDSVLSIRENHDGSLCVQTSDGSACLGHQAFSGAPELDRSRKPDAVPLVVTADGAAWTATPTGLLRSIHGQSTPVTMPEGFTGSDILTLYPDREGNLWVGSENAGAAILRQPPFVTLGKRDGLASDQVRSLFEDTDGGLWFGSSAGLTHLRDGHFNTFTVAQGLISNQIIALAGSAANDIWVGTPDGLSHVQGNHVSTLTASDGLPDDDIRSLLEARDHTLWIGTTHGLAHLTPGKPDIGTWTTADGLPSNVIGSLLEDTDGSLRIGTRAGLAHLINGKIEHYSDAHGPAAPIITALGRDPDSRIIWVGTSGLGLLENRGGGDLFSSQIAGLLPRTIYSILPEPPSQDQAGQNQAGQSQAEVWFGSADGIYRIFANSPLNPSATTQVTRYDVADGLRIADCSSGGHPEAIRTADGLLLFATSKGVSVVRPSEIPLHSPPPPIALETILVDEAAFDFTAPLHVPAGRERISFHYAGLHFAAPNKVLYRYQLDHFDRSWIDAGTRRTAYYTNIPPGHYTFRVLASIDGANWSAAAAAVELTIAPHYYQTWWFYVVLLVLVALIAWQLYIYRLRQVELRFGAVLAERNRIAREIHDTLAQDIVGISVQLELVSRLMTLSIDKAKAQLQETRTLVRTSLQQARSSIWDLRSSSAGDLPTRLRDAAKQITRESGIALRMSIGGTYRAFSQAIEDEVLRIAQEAITNAVRHAQPGRLEVSLTYHAKGARLEVTDDGRGFVVGGDRTGPAGHYGIRGMHERADRAHATLEIRSSPGAGTTVIAEAPQG